MRQHTRFSELDEERMHSSAVQEAAARERRAIMLGEQIRRLRRERGLTQGALAERAGVTQAAVARVEVGDAEPKLSTLARISEALGAQLIVEVRALETPRADG